jgi:hypothetical protein
VSGRGSAFASPVEPDEIDEQREQRERDDQIEEAQPARRPSPHGAEDSERDGGVPGAPC